MYDSIVVNKMHCDEQESYNRAFLNYFRHQIFLVNMLFQSSNWFDKV